MKVCVVREKSLKEFNNTIKPNLQKIDLVLFSFNTIPQISYEKEILNETSSIKQLINLSKELHTSIVIPSIFDLFDEKKFSVLICENGKLVDIINENENNKIHLFMLNKKRVAFFTLNEIFKDEIVKQTMKGGVDIVLSILDTQKTELLGEKLKSLQKEYNAICLALTPKCLFSVSKENNALETNFCNFFVKEF